jgi:hypothetical protein
MRHSMITAPSAFASLAIAVFSIWFFPLQGLILAGLVIGTGFMILTAFLMLITNILIGEDN